eukprot:4142175-Amphidinium_carterae.2
MFWIYVWKKLAPPHKLCLYTMAFLLHLESWLFCCHPESWLAQPCRRRFGTFRSRVYALDLHHAASGHSNLISLHLKGSKMIGVPWEHYAAQVPPYVYKFLAVSKTIAPSVQRSHSQEA